MRLALILFCCTGVLAARAAHPVSMLPDECRQAAVVRAPGWNTSTASLQRYERSAEKAGWQKIGDPLPVLIGDRGLAWGRGLHRIPDDGAPRKTEGDRRAPAGIFHLGPAFGTQPREAIGGLKLAYAQLKPTTEAIDDSASRYYNRIVDRAQVPRVDWRSSEKMAHIVPYELGLVVAHNPENVPGAGSCIFLHLWTPRDRGTAGCTVLHRPDLLALLRWLDPAKQPVLIQWPAGVPGNPLD